MGFVKIYMKVALRAPGLSAGAWWREAPEGVCLIVDTQSGAEISADELARQMGTINYEIVTMQSRRVPRFFYKGGALVSSENYLV